MRVADKSVAETKELLNAAAQSGINMLDLADIYGEGQSEIVVGAALAEDKSLREKFFIQSKCGINKHGHKSCSGDLFTYYDYSYQYIIDSVEGILSRLRTDRIDSLLLHRPDVLFETDEVCEAFSRLHDSGKVLNFGVSNHNRYQMELLQKNLPFKLCANQLQLSCAFTPMFDAALNVNMENGAAVMRDGGTLEYCRLHDIPVQAWSSLQYGYFQGVFLGSEKFPELNRTLEAVAEELDTTPTAVALAWILRYPAKMQAVIGTTRPERVRESVQASELALSREQWYDIYVSAGNELP